MKITLNQLRRIIKEEVSKHLREAVDTAVELDDGMLYYVDDEGNRTKIGPIAGSEFEDQLHWDGQRIPFSGSPSSLKGMLGGPGPALYPNRRR
jgi:hypothetical protein